MPPTNHLANGQVPLEDGVPVGVPVEQVGRLAGPEALVVGVGLVVASSVDDEGRALELLGRREGALLEVVPRSSPGQPWRQEPIGHRPFSENFQSRHSSTRKAPRPDGSVRAAASVTRLRAFSASRSPMAARSSHAAPRLGRPARRCRGPASNSAWLRSSSGGRTAASWSTATSVVMSCGAEAARADHRPGRGPGRSAATPSTAGRPSTAWCPCSRRPPPGPG